MSNMAHFHPDYKLLDNLILNQENNESTCLMDFSAAKTEGDFAAHPAYLDAITQVAGFTMNANDNVDLDKEVFVNHGWESLQIYRPLQKGVTYEVYTKMQKGKDHSHGDIIVLDGDNVVAFFKAFSVSLRLRVMRHITFADFNSFALSLVRACALCSKWHLTKVSGSVTAILLRNRRLRSALFQS